MSRDQMVMALLPQLKSALWTSVKALFSVPRFNNISSSVTRDKEIFQSHMVMK